MADLDLGSVAQLQHRSMPFGSRPSSLFLINPSALCGSLERYLHHPIYLGVGYGWTIEGSAALVCQRNVVPFGKTNVIPLGNDTYLSVIPNSRLCYDCPSCRAEMSPLYITETSEVLLHSRT